MKTKTYSEIINSVGYGQLRNNDPYELKMLMREYAMKQMNNGTTTQSIVDLYNKTFQMNDKGFIDYIERREGKMPQKYMVGAWTL